MNKVVIKPLGTVSPYCNNKLMCPGFLLKYERYNILLDCGNGITSNMDFPCDLNNLHVILSHYHKDHIGDIDALQYASYIYHNMKSINNKINIYLPKKDYFESLESVLKNNIAYAEYMFIDENTKLKIGDLKIEFYDNKSHYIDSLIIIIKLDDLKIVYTSDIGNTNIKGLINICMNADLLICESTYVTSNANNGHFNAKEAAKLANKSNTKLLMLTHFWPETPKEKYLKEAKKIFKNTIVAKENKILELGSDNNVL